MSDDPISDVVKRQIAAHVDRMLVDAMLGGTYTATEAKPIEPLTMKSVALSMARATFDADVHITEFEPKPDKDGKVAGALVIDNTMLPGWEDKKAIARVRGEPAPNARTIVFPSVENALQAVALATRKP